MRMQQRFIALADRPHLPRRTVRLRLTLLYGALFVLCGAGLLAITYALVVHATNGFIFKSQDGVAVSVVGSAKGAGSQGAKMKQIVGTKQLLDGSGPDALTAQQAQAQLKQLEALAGQQHAAALHQLLLSSGIALAVMAVISIALGWLVAGRVLRPLRTITTAVRHISATNLHERLALPGPDDELKELGDTFDGLVSRLDASFQAQRRFVANASHELRTPLARQRALSQVALADPDATVESLRAAHERVLVAGAQQEQLIEALLTLARGQAGVDRPGPVDLASLTDRVLATRRVEAARRDLDLKVALAPAPATGDVRLLERLVTNLLDNALRHNIVAYGHIDIRTRTRAGHAILTISNTGPVIPADAVERLFQPFRRLNADRTGHGDGLGLGLSIVEAIVDAHGAAITARPQRHGGLAIEVNFPIPAPDSGNGSTIAPPQLASTGSR